MFNMNSSIVNNVLGGFIPPNPIMNVGGVNYNQQTIDPVAQQTSFQQYINPQLMNQGSFYNNIYNGYYNPYLAQKQQQIQEIEQKEQAKKVAEVWKKLSRACNEALDNKIENWDEHLKQYDLNNKVEEEKSTLKVVLINDKDEVICDPKKVGYYSNRPTFTNETDIIKNLIRIEMTAIPYNIQMANKVLLNNKMYDETKKKFNDSMGLIEYLDKAGELYSDALMAEYRTRKNNMKNTYENDTFKELLKHNSSKDSYFNQCFSPEYYSGIRPGSTLGSLEVTLPEHIGSKYNEVRQRFMDSILNKGGAN